MAKYAIDIKQIVQICTMQYAIYATGKICNRQYAIGNIGNISDMHYLGVQ